MDTAFSQPLVNFYQKRKLDCRTEWVCFDEYRKIVYGFRIFDENKLDMIKFNVLTSVKEKSIRQFRFYYGENVEVDNDFYLKSNPRCDLIGLVNLVRKGFLENGAECCMIFHQFYVESGACKSYYIEKVNEIGSFGAFFQSDSGWIVRFNFPAGFSADTAKYYRLLLNDQTNDGYLEYLTSFDFTRDCRLCDMILELSGKTHLLLIFSSLFYVFDYQTKNWTSRVLDNTNLPLSKIIGDDPSHLYAGLLDSGFLLRFNEPSGSWVQSDRRIDMSNFVKAFASSEFLFIISRCCPTIGPVELDNSDEEENVDDEDDDCIDNFGKFYDINMLSLRDLCIFQLAKSFRSFFDARADKEICDSLNFPQTLVREYFGPAWSLTEIAGRINHCVALWANSDDDMTSV